MGRKLLYKNKGKTRKRGRSTPTATSGVRPMPKKVMRAIKNGTYEFEEDGEEKELLNIDWDWIKRGGRPKKFESPEIFARAAKEYFIWSRRTPWKGSEWKDGKYQSKPLGRPFTWGGLAIRLGISEEYIRNFRNQLNKEDPDYIGFTSVLAAIDSIMRTQKFEGAAVGVFNANLIAYDLGLKKDVPMMMGGATALNINVAVESQSKLLDEVRSALEAIDIEHEEVKEETKQLNGNGKSNGKH